MTLTKHDEHDLREHEASLLAREAELLRAAVALREQTDLELVGRLEAARARVELPEDMAQRVEETLRHLASGPRDLAGAILGHRVACVELEAKTAARWLEVLATDDPARRAGILHAIRLQNQQRARALLAWQKTIDDARRRAHLAQQLAGQLDPRADLSPPSRNAAPPPAAGAFEPEEESSGVVLHLPEELHATAPPPAGDLDVHVSVQPAEGAGSVRPAAGAIPSLLPVRISFAPGAASRSVRPGSPSRPPVLLPSRPPRAMPSRPPPPRPEDKRIAPRLALAEPIAIAGGDHQFYTGFTENISGNGLFIASFDLPLRLGDVCLVEFEMPDGFVVQTEATVCWQRVMNRDTPDVMPGFGVRFLALTPEQEERIDAYIAAEGSLFYDE